MVNRYSVGGDRNDANGSLVKYTDYAELQKDNETLRAMMREVEIRLDALVAENAALKHAISEINNSAEEVEHDGHLTFVINPDYLHCAVDLIESETPTTDAAIAEIGARAVEQLISDRKREWLESYIDDAQQLANKLRGGGA
ncbi:hypothetical protein [Pectobacterium carotovorum]|uniref:hypothetical protein n=1 Tax=Pectobacterium carotovorum TaxID=554 RepID=UPI0020806A98|nr:hypothetical protein [Pectobacterium carotovorum]GKV89335.1 hypothetical protein PEC301619_13170 [Pectobacterium carotovorum subsp. carotovorum]